MPALSKWAVIVNKIIAIVWKTNGGYGFDAASTDGPEPLINYSQIVCCNA